MSMNIDPFQAGSEDNTLSASRMNELVDRLNAFTNMVVKPDGIGKLIIGQTSAVLELASVASETGSPVKFVPVTSVAGLTSGYVTCTIDGTATSVAIPWALRTAQKPGSTYIRLPEYEVSQYLAVGRSSNGTGVTSVDWIDLGAGRGWVSEAQCKFVPITSVAGLESGYVTCTIDTIATSVAIPWELRTAQKPSALHVRLPEYVSGQYLVVSRSLTGTGVASVDWIDLGAGRGWGISLPLCVDGVVKHITLVGGTIGV